jgi:hypothetical protein
VLLMMDRVLGRFAGHQRCPQDLALSANVAFFRIAAERLFLSLRSVETGIFFPFLVPVARRNEPCLDFLMWMGARFFLTE